MRLKEFQGCGLGKTFILYKIFVVESYVYESNIQDFADYKLQIHQKSGIQEKWSLIIKLDMHKL